MKAARLATLLLALFALGGCASASLVAHQPSVDGVAALRGSGLANMAVGEFNLAPGLKPAAGRSVSARGHAFTSPNGASFADYLREALQTDLRAAGKLDAASPYVVGGEVTQNELNAAGASTARSTLAARFRVTKSGQELFVKELRVEHQWESSFMGAIAIPTAFDQYTEQYSRLLNALYQDDDFRKACRP